MNESEYMKEARAAYEDSYQADTNDPSQAESFAIFLLGFRAALLSHIAKGEQARAATVPEGCKLVPLEPTPEMCVAASEQVSYDNRRGTVTVSSNIYRAMLAASPTTAGQQAGGLVVVGYRRKVAVLNSYTYEVCWHWSTKTGEGWEPIYGHLSDGENAADAGQQAGGGRRRPHQGLTP